MHDLKIPIPLQPIHLKSVEPDIFNLRARLGHGLCWTDISSDSAWLNFELSPCARFTLHPSDPLLMIRTPVAELLFSDHTILQLASHLQFNPQWSPEVISEIAKLASANMDQSLIKALGGAVEVFMISSDSINDNDAYQPLLLTLTSKLKNERFTLSLQTTPEMARQWLSDTAWKNKTLPHRFDTLPMWGKIWLGNTKITSGELMQLEIGDAIAIENIASSDDELKIQFSPLYVTVARLNPTQYSVIYKEWSNLMAIDDDIALTDSVNHEFHDEEQPTTESIEAIPITLNFTVGQVQLPFKELQTLLAGSVIELGRQADTRVQITANGKHIGTGELVSVEGRLAVELIQLSH